MRPITKSDRAAECAAYLQGIMEDDEDFRQTDLEGRLQELLDESAESAARVAGYTEAEIAAAWDIINEQEGA